MDKISIRGLLGRGLQNDFGVNFPFCPFLLIPDTASQCKIVKQASVQDSETYILEGFSLSDSAQRSRDFDLYMQ